MEEQENVLVKKIVRGAREATKAIENYSQEEIDRVVKAVGWAIYEEERATQLAEIAVEDTGLGNVQDKILKNQRKTLGTLNDLLQVKTVGIVEENLEKGLVKYSKPVGVVGTLTPSTNPAATPANQAMMAIKGGNAIIISPSPTGARTARKLEEYIHTQLKQIGAPLNLFQVMPGKVSFTKAAALMEAVDLVLVTGDQANVRKGYSSGTPCIGVGKGNVPVIIDKSANLEEAAEKIKLSKTFDNATSCSSENAIVVHADIYEKFLDVLSKVGGRLCSAQESTRIEEILFGTGSISRSVVGKDIKALAALTEVDVNQNDRFYVVEQEGIGPQYPLSGEKLSLVVSVYKAVNFDNCIEICNEILDYEGLGHSVGLHCDDPELGRIVAERTKVARVLVNQAHTFGNGGGFNNSLPFTLSMGCGTWAGNSISENLSIKNFVNTTTLALPIAEKKVNPNLLFAEVNGSA